MKMKRKYFNNGNECIAIDDLSEFIRIKENTNECEDIVETIYNILEKTKDENIVSRLESVVKNYLAYTQNGLIIKDKKKFVCWKIISFNMPEDLKESLVNLESELRKNSSALIKINDDEKIV